MTVQPDHELEVLEDDENVPPRPEELIADAGQVAQPPGPLPAPRVTTPD